MRAALLASLKSLSPASFKVSRFEKLCTSSSILHQSAFQVSPTSLEYSLQMTSANHSERKCVPNYPALPYPCGSNSLLTRTTAHARGLIEHVCALYRMPSNSQCVCHRYCTIIAVCWRYARTLTAPRLV